MLIIRLYALWVGGAMCNLKLVVHGHAQSHSLNATRALPRAMRGSLRPTVMLLLNGEQCFDDQYVVIYMSSLSLHVELGYHAVVLAKDDNWTDFRNLRCLTCGCDTIIPITVAAERGRTKEPRLLVSKSRSRKVMQLLRSGKT